MLPPAAPVESSYRVVGAAEIAPAVLQKILGDIRIEYGNIEQSAPAMLRLEDVMPNGSVAGAAVTFLADANGLRKAVVRHTGGSREVVEELFFRHDSLFFAFRRTTFRDGAERALEDRFYLSGERVVRWQNSDGNLAALGGSLPSRRATWIHGSAMQALSVWRERSQSSP